MIDYCKATTINDQLNDRYVAENAYENVTTFPKLITLTTTMSCNYRCWMCYQQKFTGDLDWRIVEALESVFPFVKTLQLFGGEPLLYPKIAELCSIASKFCCELDIITNGSTLDAERRAMLLNNNVSLVKISIEASTPETYRSIRGGDFSSVISNIKALVDEKIKRGLVKPVVQINFVAMRRNIGELASLVRLAEAIGVDKVIVLFLSCGNRIDLAQESLFFFKDLADQCMAEAMEISRNSDIEIIIPGFFSKTLEKKSKNTIDKTCHSPWKNCLIDIYGNVSFCCGGGGSVGNILESDFNTIWSREKISTFRKSVNTDTQPGCCNTCRVKSRNYNDIFFHIRDKKLAAKLLAEV